MQGAAGVYHLLVLGSVANIYGSFLPFSSHQVFLVSELDCVLPCCEKNGTKADRESVSRKTVKVNPIPPPFHFSSKNECVPILKSVNHPQHIMPNVFKALVKDVKIT